MSKPEDERKPNHEDLCKNIQNDICKPNEEEVLKCSKDDVCKSSEGKKGATGKTDVKNIVGKVIEGIQKGSCPKQLAIGTVSGWITGFTTMKIGKPVAIAVGGSIILFQLAQHKSLIKTDWNQVRTKAYEQNFIKDLKGKAPNLISQSKKFAKSNTCFAAGFVGGFLIGLAS